MGPQLSDREKIDRAAFHEEVRFYKKQQWAVAAAGALLLGAFLAVVRGAQMAGWEKCLALVLIVVGVFAGLGFLWKLQSDLAKVRRTLDPSDRKSKTRGLPIVLLQGAILVVTAVVVSWVALFRGALVPPVPI
jgi:hypothetical protein